MRYVYLRHKSVRRPGSVSSSFWGSKWKVVPWLDRSAPPCPAPDLLVTPRPSGVSGFWIRQMSIKAAAIGIFGAAKSMFVIFVVDLSNPKPGHTAGGTGRGGAQRRGGQRGCGAARWGAAGRSGAGWDGGGWNDVPRGETVHLAPQGTGETRPGRLSGGKQNESFCKPDRGTPRVVDDWFISRTASALRSWLLTNGLAFFCLCKPFSCEAYPRTYIEVSDRDTTISLSAFQGRHTYFAELNNGCHIAALESSGSLRKWHCVTLSPGKGVL